MLFILTISEGGSSATQGFKSAFSKIINKINIPFHMFTGHVDSLFYEVDVQVFCPYFFSL